MNKKHIAVLQGLLNHWTEHKKQCNQMLKMVSGHYQAGLDVRSDQEKIEALDAAIASLQSQTETGPEKLPEPAKKKTKSGTKSESDLTASK